MEYTNRHCPNGVSGLATTGAGDHGPPSLPGTRPIGPSEPFVFAEVYKTYFRFVLRTLRRCGVGGPDLVDMSQNVFLAVYRSLARFEGRSDLSSWLYGICRHVALSHRRARYLRHEIVADCEMLEMHPRCEDMEHPFENGEIAAAILARLPMKMRHVFVLFVVHQMSGPEIAALLRAPNKSVIGS
jgi:RNA polymerase sigma-70 factor (ECF subfamily)